MKTLKQRILSRILPKSFRASVKPEQFAREYRQRKYVCEDGRAYAEYAGMATDPLGAFQRNVKTVAFYLPQMHPIPENDMWWGKGFTEWTNVSKAVPRFLGHYQPRLPGELGFYDLRLPEVMERQVELANLYGLDAFCFYYYWFGGKRLLEGPLNTFLQRRDLNLSFCLCWANENWTRRWDGLDRDILIAQDYGRADAEAIVQDWLRHFADPRYLQVDGKPLLLIYRPDLIPDFAKCAEIWRAAAETAGFKGLHILGVSAFRNAGGMLEGLDGLYEFPPHNVSVPAVNPKLKLLDSDYKGHAFDYAAVVDAAVHRDETVPAEPNIHPGVLVGWDTEARKPGRGDVMIGATPAHFRRWVQSAFDRALKTLEGDRRLIFINAWNEWAEGAYLEPDRRHGYGFLTALRSVVRQYGTRDNALEELCARHNASAGAAGKKAVICHLFYYDLVGEFASILHHARQHTDLDLVLTVPNLWSVEQVRESIAKLQPRKLFATENVGRDVYPFLYACRQIGDDGYESCCKIHSKKSTHRIDGHVWRSQLLSGLLSDSALAFLEDHFFAPNTRYAIAAPKDAFLSLGAKHHVDGNLQHLDMLQAAYSTGSYRSGDFIAGTMFWFKFADFRELVAREWTTRDFGHDLGEVDGTLAHAFERFFSVYAASRHLSVLKMPQSLSSFDIEIGTPAKA